MDADLTADAVLLKHREVSGVLSSYWASDIATRVEELVGEIDRLHGRFLGRFIYRRRIRRLEADLRFVVEAGDSLPLWGWGDE